MFPSVSKNVCCIVISHRYTFLCRFSILTAFRGQPSGEGHQKGSYIGEVITWSIFHLLRPPLRLCVCTYLALSNWRFTLYEDSLFILFTTPKSHYQCVTGGISILNMAINKQNQLFTDIFLKVLNSGQIYIANFASAQAK